MCIFVIFIYVYQINNDIVGNLNKSFSLINFILVKDLKFTTPVGLRPRVYYTLANFRGGGGQGPLAPPSIPQCK